MTNQLPPVFPYSTAPAVPNFGTRAARASWMAPLVALLLLVITFRLLYDHVVSFGLVTLIGGGVFWITGLVSGVVAIATMQRYGRDRVQRPAIIGLCMTVAMHLLAFFIAAVFMSGPV